MAFEPGRMTIVAARLGDPWARDVPGSIPAACEVCGRGVMISPRAGLMHEAEGLSVVCVDCFARHRDAGHRVELRFEPE